jgi:hypothetical protein
MILKSELEDWSRRIVHVLTDVNTCLNNLRILRIEGEKKVHIIKHPFFTQFYHQQRFILIVQLAKFFSVSKSQKININKLIQRLKTEPLDKELLQLISDNETKLTDVFKSNKEIQASVLQIETELIDKKSVVDSIEYLRNKVYAHSDPDRGGRSLPYDDLEQIVKFANDIYNTLYGKIFDRHLDVERTADWDVRYIILKLSNLSN